MSKLKCKNEVKGITLNGPAQKLMLKNEVPGLISILKLKGRGPSLILRQKRQYDIAYIAHILRT